MRRSHSAVSTTKTCKHGASRRPQTLTHIPVVENGLQARCCFQLKRFDVCQKVPTWCSVLVESVETETTGIVHRFGENEGKIVSIGTDGVRTILAHVDPHLLCSHAERREQKVLATFEKRRIDHAFVEIILDGVVGRVVEKDVAPENALGEFSEHGPERRRLIGFGLVVDRGILRFGRSCRAGWNDVQVTSFDVIEIVLVEAQWSDANPVEIEHVAEKFDRMRNLEHFLFVLIVGQGFVLAVLVRSATFGSLLRPEPVEEGEGQRGELLRVDHQRSADVQRVVSVVKDEPMNVN